MEFNRAISLYLDTTGPLKPARFLTSRGSSSQLQGSALTLISSDSVLVKLFLLKPADAVGELAECLTQDGTIFMTLKPAPGTATQLAVATGWTFVADAVDGDHYEAVLDLNTAEIAAEMASVESLAGLFDIEMQAPANTRRITYQSNFSLFKQVQTGDEPDPTPSSAISSFIANAQDTVNGLVEDSEAATAAAIAATADTVAAIAEAEALAGSVSWGGTGGDELTVGGETSPPLTGPAGPQGIPGAMAGTAGVVEINESGAATIVLTDEDHNGRVLEVYTSTEMDITVLELNDTLPVGFACEVVWVGLSGNVTITLASGSTRALLQADSLYSLRAVGSIASIRTTTTRHVLAGDLA